MTQYQRDIERTANELLALQAGKDQPHIRAAIDAQSIRDEMRADGIVVAVRFYTKVANYLMAEAWHSKLPRNEWWVTDAEMRAKYGEPEAKCHV